MFQYYVWRARYALIALAALTVLTALFLLSFWMFVENDSPKTNEPPTLPMFIVERTYTKDEGFSYLYSDGKYLYDNDLRRLPSLSPSALDRIEVDILAIATGDFETYAGSQTINPLSIVDAGFQYDIPYNFYGTQQDIALFIALMLGTDFEVESLCESKDSAILELCKDDETVRIVIGRNRLRVYSKLIGIDEFG